MKPYQEMTQAELDEHHKRPAGGWTPDPFWVAAEARRQPEPWWRRRGYATGEAFAERLARAVWEQHEHRVRNMLRIAWRKLYEVEPAVLGPPPAPIFPEKPRPTRRNSSALVVDRRALWRRERRRAARRRFTSDWRASSAVYAIMRESS